MASHIGKKRLQGLRDPVRKDLIAMRHNSGLEPSRPGAARRLAAGTHLGY